MMSHRVWQQEYGSDPKVVGSTFVLDGHPFTIVGITPPGFYGETLRGDPPELFVPLQQEPVLAGTEYGDQDAVGLVANYRPVEARVRRRTEWRRGLPPSRGRGY